MHTQRCASRDEGSEARSTAAALEDARLLCAAVAGFGWARVRVPVPVTPGVCRCPDGFEPDGSCGTARVTSSPCGCCADTSASDGPSGCSTNGASTPTPGFGLVTSCFSMRSMDAGRRGPHGFLRPPSPWTCPHSDREKSCFRESAPPQQRRKTRRSRTAGHTPEWPASHPNVRGPLPSSQWPP